jgi:hypothetical protein
MRQMAVPYRVRVVAAPPPPPAPSTAAPTTTTVRAQPAPPGPWITPTKPVTVTVRAPSKTIDAPVQAPPPAGITVEQLAAYDRQFVANLQARGWAVWDPLAITHQAYRVCAMLQRGASPQWVVQQLIGPTTPLSDAQSFVTTAMLTYPGCP